MIEVSIIRLPICKTTPPIKLSSISDLSLIVPFTFSEISFSISEIVLSSICFDENKFALISPFLCETSFKNSSIISAYKKYSFFIYQNKEKVFYYFISVHYI